MAIDGPAGAGKSTVAKEVARRLSYLYLDTGALYRAVALAFQRAGVSPTDANAVDNALLKLDLRLDPNGRVFLGQEEVSQEIRTREISAQVSSVASIPNVRAKLVKIQQAFGRGEGFQTKPDGLVAEGRDIGTVVFPDATHKFFLTANLETRAKRRQKEFVRDGQPLSVEIVMQEIAKRDDMDSKRAIAPLIKAKDAVEVDTSSLTIEESIEAILKKIAERAS